MVGQILVGLKPDTTYDVVQLGCAMSASRVAAAEPMLRDPLVTDGPQIGGPIASVPRGEQRRHRSDEAQSDEDPNGIHAQILLST